MYAILAGSPDFPKTTTVGPVSLPQLTTKDAWYISYTLLVEKGTAQTWFTDGLVYDVHEGQKWMVAELEDT